MLFQKNREGWIKKFANGLKLDGKLFRIKLFGGDLSVSSKIFLSVTMLGVIEKNFHKNTIVTENSEIYVGGNIGDAAIGLDIIKKKRNTENKNFFLKKLFLPEPQIILGRSLNGIAEFCTDISDGLINELELVANNSKLKANIFVPEIPLSVEALKLIEKSKFKKKMLELILTGGEDYKLLFSIRKNKKRTFNE